MSELDLDLRQRDERHCLPTSIADTACGVERDRMHSRNIVDVRPVIDHSHRYARQPPTFGRQVHIGCLTYGHHQRRMLSLDPLQRARLHQANGLRVRRCLVQFTSDSSEVATATEQRGFPTVTRTSQ